MDLETKKQDRTKHSLAGSKTDEREIGCALRILFFFYRFFSFSCPEQFIRVQTRTWHDSDDTNLIRVF